MMRPSRWRAPALCLTVLLAAAPSGAAHAATLGLRGPSSLSLQFHYGVASFDMAKANRAVDRLNLLFDLVERDIREGGVFALPEDFHIPDMAGFDQGTLPLVSLQWGMSPSLLADVEATYLFDRATAATESFRADYSASAWPITLNLRYRAPVPRTLHWSWYAGGGAGWLFGGRWQEEVFSAGPVTDQKYTGQGPTAQTFLGIEYLAWDSLGFGIEARYRDAVITEVKDKYGDPRKIETTDPIQVGPPGTGQIILLPSRENLELDFSGWQVAAGVRYYFFF